MREIVERDEDQIETILHSMEAIRAALDERYDEVQNLTVLCAKRKIHEIFSSEGTSFQVWTYNDFY